MVTKKTFNLLYLVFGLVLLFYLAIPAPRMPNYLPNSVKSDQPADLEDPFRVGFYTDMTRDEVINYYKSQFAESAFLGIHLPQVRLNYPPEEAQTRIRDQTASTFLEELAHPGRESLYINGYEPKLDQNPLVAAGRPWRQKIIIGYIRSMSYVRLFVGVLSLVVLYMVIMETYRFGADLVKGFKKWKKR